MLLLKQAVEHAVDESCRLFRAEAAGQFNRLIDRDFGWRIEFKHFERRQPKDVAIGCREPVQFPVSHRLLDSTIQFCSMLLNPLNQLIPEFDEFRAMQQSPGQKGFPVSSRVEVPLEQHLQNDLANPAAA